MIFTFPLICSDLIDSELVSYIAKTIEHQYAVENIEEIKSMILRIVEEKEENIMSQIEQYHSQQKNKPSNQENDRDIDEFSEYIVSKGKRQILQKFFSKREELIKNIQSNILYKNGRDLNNIEPSIDLLLEANIQINKKDTLKSNLIEPTWLSFDVSIPELNFEQTITVGIKTLVLVQENLQDLFNTISGYYSYQENKDKEQRYLSKPTFWNKIKYIFLKVKSTIKYLFERFFPNLFLKRYVNYLLNHYNAEHLYFIKKIFKDYHTAGFCISINDIRDTEFFNPNNSKYVLRFFKEIGFTYFVIDDPIKKIIYVWNMNQSLRYYYSITYSMIYNTMYRKTVEDIDRVKQTTQQLFSIRKPIGSLNKLFKK